MEEEEKGSDLGKSDSEHIFPSEEESDQYNLEPIDSNYDSKEESKGGIIILKENLGSQKIKKTHNLERKITRNEAKKATISKLNILVHDNSTEDDEERTNLRQWKINLIQ